MKENNYNLLVNQIFDTVLHSHPKAIAHIGGSKNYPRIDGFAHFYDTAAGCVVIACVQNLPQNSPFFGMHIHQKGVCEDNFSSAGAHWDDGLHPQHTGDLPSLKNANGNTFTMFLDSNFTAIEAIGKSIIIHAMPDDFTSQPAGNSGERIACGIIKTNKNTI